MLIYKNSTKQFVEDVRLNVIGDIMRSNFKARWSRDPGASEFASWQNSLSRVRDVIEVAGLEDNMIALEYEVPYNQNRIDCLLFGCGVDAAENVFLIELKQWSSVKALPDEGNFVETYTGGAEKVVPHPSQQAKGYHNYLKGFVAEFETKPELTLFSCAYCHNYTRTGSTGLHDPVYTSLIQDFPIYTKEDVKLLAAKLKELLKAGKGFEIFNRFMRSPLKPSKKLLENVTKVIRNEVVFSLLNEQLVAKNLIWSKVHKNQKAKTKSVIIVHGGPGTGKSLIALNILAEAAQKGQQVFYGCKSKPFTEGLRKLVGSDGAMLFSNLYRFVPSKVGENQLDLLLIDEAHRIEKNSNHQYTRSEDRSDMPQVEQLIRCAKTSVFFIDDRQNVRSQEIGHSDLIREHVAKYKCDLSEVTLLTQYRCMGSNDYLLWVESVLGYQPEPRVLSKNEVFDFQIFDSPTKLYAQLAKHESNKPNSARMVAGFCWPWSKTVDASGELVKDVRIGDFAMPWETHGDITRPPKGYVKWYEWAYRPEGFKQVGCIYTAQGFEFDYVGVIIGDDLAFDSTAKRLVGNISATKDPTLRKSRENFELHMKNIYRTLLTRGMRGCYVYFTNKQTEEYFRRQIETRPAQPTLQHQPLKESFIGFTGTPIEKTDANTRAVFGDYISIYDIQRAVADKATVPIYYESRISKLSLNAAELPKLDAEFEEITEGEELSKKEKLKTKWAALEALVGDPKRIALVAADLVAHFEKRVEAMDGKGMIVCMSRRICVDLYEALIKLRPEWAEETLKVVMTGSADDGPEWQKHIRSKDARRKLANRFKDAKDAFKIVIVRDMWLTGFDAPCLHTMYADKPMQGHGLMQAIARVNRVFRDKPGGLVVDYLGLADQLKKALVTYTESGGQGNPTFDTAQAIACDLMHGFNWDKWTTGKPTERLALIPAGQEHILEQEDGKKRWVQVVSEWEMSNDEFGMSN